MNLTERLMALWNSHSKTGLTELYTADFAGLDVTDRTRVTGIEGLSRRLERIWQAFPDLKFDCAPPIEQDNRIALYWVARGTQQGIVLNIPPTGRKVAIHGLTLLRVQDDKINQSIQLWDMAGLLRDLGLLPELDYRAPQEPLSLKDLLPLWA